MLFPSSGSGTQMHPDQALRFWPVEMLPTQPPPPNLPMVTLDASLHLSENIDYETNTEVHSVSDFSCEKYELGDMHVLFFKSLFHFPKLLLGNT